ncbi:MAG: HlyD family efflux transporter periplasmic adaptor subunit [Cyanobacteria bacterium J06642_11]
MQSEIPNHSPVNPAALSAAIPADFLPPIRRWQRLGGLAGVVSVVTALGLAQVVTFRETVHAPAVIRPTGELRLVEATASGQVREILVQENESVQAGEAIAHLDDTELQNQASQLGTTITQLQQQLIQLNNQLQALEQRTVATTAQIQGSLRASTAELTLAQQQFQESQLVNQADLRQRQAQVRFAQETVDSYRQLVDQGAIATSQLREQEVALESARADLEKAKVTALPSAAEVTIAQQQIARTQAEGSANLAQLQQEAETLNQQRSDLLNQLNQAQQDLAQTTEDITQLTLKAPVSGIVQSLELRNPAQVVNPGETIAEIAANDDVLVAKAWVAPQDISTIDQQQSVQLRISACPYTDYGTLDATVQTISPDTVPAEAIPQEGHTTINSTLYEITLQLAKPSLSTQHLTCQLQAGMTGQANILTREDTVLRLVWRKLRLITQL